MSFKDFSMSFEDIKLAIADFITSCGTLCPLALLGVFLTFMILYDHYDKRGLPPGPPALPLLGNYFSLPKSKSWLLFTSWSKKYVSTKLMFIMSILKRVITLYQGGIYTFYNGLTPRVIISDPHIAFKLLTGRSNKYSSRPPQVMFDKFSQGSSIISHPYGLGWNLRRKVFHQFLNITAIQIYKERQEAEASRMIYQISQDEGKQWKQAIERFISSIIFSLSYGRRIDSLDSKVLKKKLRMIGYAAGFLVPGRYVVESLPILNYLPSFIARWKNPVMEMGKENKEFDIGLVDNVREDMEKSNGVSEGKGSLTENMILGAQAGDRDLQTLQMNDGHFAGISSSLFGAGSVTTIKSLGDCVLAMILHPWVFVAAQKEIDEVVGSFRSPTFEDREKLPYLDALVKETLRWRPVIPNGLNHATSEADVYEGYRIPKGTTISFNTWGMHQDPTYFPSPEEFAPERFLPETDERFREELKGENIFPGRHGHSGFGWGRRICAGADLATNNMFIALAKLIWGFELMPAEGENYEDLEFVGDFVNGVGNFRCRWRVRSEEYGNMMEGEAKVAEEVLDRFPAYE
jgi:cytochrome P450